MSVTVEEATGDDRTKWNEYVERSPQCEVFHRLEALEAQARHAGANLRLLVGFKGQEPVGVFPVFVVRKGPVPTVFSPPPSLRVSYLGPGFLNMAKLKPRKAERRRRRFLEGCLEWIDEEIGPWYAHVRTSPAFDDTRPFQWEGSDVTPNHTYLVDLDQDEDELLASFSRDARSNVTGEYEAEYEIQVGDRDAIENICAQVRERYQSQDKAFGVTPGFVTDLYDALPAGALRPYVLRVENEFVGGILAFEHGETVSRWQGGVRTDVDLPINDLLDWRIMADGIDRGLRWYDLVGADNPRINRYKSKFAPELRTFYQIEDGFAPVIQAAHLYDRFK